MTVDRGVDGSRLQAVAAKALELIADGDRVGLGSGRAASVFIVMLGGRIAREGLRVSALPTSHSSAELARQAGIPLIESGQEVQLDITVDGADEVAPNLDLVKGWGGALVRERMVAAASKRQVIIVGEEKLVHALGERGKVPVEVLPLPRWPATREFKVLGVDPRLRMDATGQQPALTENGNFTIDCCPEAPLTPSGARELEQALLAIPGVVDTGLFLGTAEQVLVGHSDGRVTRLTRPEE